MVVGIKVGCRDGPGVFVILEVGIRVGLLETCGTDVMEGAVVGKCACVIVGIIGVLVGSNIPVDVGRGVGVFDGLVVGPADGILVFVGATVVGDTPLMV